ncbi:hypothetical protein OsJ_33138 [Oryza sativa Japonica Group]|uniref:Uncharacterized protein n=1 Tax=Oryza sativa subsp. japonica TaxID=39947 RepID=A3C935_ORYSJ|nr:hypothetical protein OsJ_33138 [Oryza sativa Japonica Group]
MGHDGPQNRHREIPSLQQSQREATAARQTRRFEGSAGQCDPHPEIAWLRPGMDHGWATRVPVQPRPWDVAGHRDDVHLVLFLVSDVSFADMWLTSTSAELIPIEETYINCAGIGLLLRRYKLALGFTWGCDAVEPCGDRRRMVSALQPGTDLPEAMSSAPRPPDQGMQ